MSQELFKRKQMNFLNKKYTSLHSSSPYSHNNSRSFLPSASTVRQTTPFISTNNCESHPSEIIRHLCLECVQLLCAECIGEHLQLHRQANVIPKIVSIKQMRIDMDSKLDHIMNLMSRNSPSQIDVESIRRRALDKIDQMRRDLVKAVDQWISIMKAHLMNSLGFDDMGKMKMEMEKLMEEVSILKNGLSNTGQPAIIKKTFQIDGEKLESSYNTMFKNYRQLQKNADFEFTVNWKELVKGFETNINIKGRNEILEESQYQQSRTVSKSNSRDIIPSKQPSYSHGQSGKKIFDLRGQ